MKPEPEIMPGEAFLTPRGTGTISGIWVDLPCGDEPRGEHSYTRSDIHTELKAENERLTAALEKIAERDTQVYPGGHNATVNIRGIYATIAREALAANKGG